MAHMITPSPRRLIDLHCDWLLQYASESTTFDPAFYAGVSGSLSQAHGYLQDTSLAILACYREADEWARQSDPWNALGQLITRIEAEFPGRILAGADDDARRLDEPNSLCWAMIGVEGFDYLVRERADLDRLRGLFERGVRVFQPVYSGSNVLAGSSSPGDDRGLLELGRAFLETLAGLRTHSAGPRPILDLAHLHPIACSDILAWFEAEGSRVENLVPVFSHGAVSHADFSTPRALTAENLKRLRALGGFVGFSVSPPFYANAEALKASIESAAALPFLDEPGYDGLAIGTDFLGVDNTLPALGTAAEVTTWFTRAFSTQISQSLLSGNAHKLIARIVGVEHVA